MPDWTTHFAESNNDKSNSRTILDWYVIPTKNKAENPSRLKGLDDNAKELFKYIIAGIVLSDESTSEEDLSSVIEKLKTYYNTLDTEAQDCELVFLDLINKAVIEFHTATHKGLYFHDPLKLEDKFINKMPDLKDHMNEQMLEKIDFFEYIGIKKNRAREPIEPDDFIRNLRKKLTANSLEDLNKLKDIHDEEPLNVKYSFKYKTRRALMMLNIVKIITEHLLYWVEDYLAVDDEAEYNSFKGKITALIDFIPIFKTYYYTILNSKEMVPPPEIFMGFYAYITAEPELPGYNSGDLEIVVSNRLHLLKWYFEKLLIILEHSEVSEIKTEECMYDLFDLTTPTTIIDSDGNHLETMDKDFYPLRTIHFRRDFVLKNPTVTIEFYKIQTDLWFNIDRIHCYPKNIPLSLFLGILSESDKLEVFYNVMEFELGQDFIQTQEELQKIRARLNKDEKCEKKIEPKPEVPKKYTLDDPVVYGSFVSYLYYLATYLTDAYLLKSQNNPSNDYVINKLILDARLMLEAAVKEVNEMTVKNQDITVDALIKSKRMTKENVTLIIWTEGCINRLLNSYINALGQKVENKFTEENVMSQSLRNILQTIYKSWFGADAKPYFQPEPIDPGAMQVETYFAW